MLKEAEKVHLEYEISGEPLPGSRSFIENSLLELGKGMTRHSIGEVPHSAANDLKGIENIAEALSKIQVDDPNLCKDLRLDTDNGIFQIGALTIAKAEAAKESTWEPKTKVKLEAFEEEIAQVVHKALNIRMTRAQFIKRGANLGFALVLAACGIRPVTPTITPGATSTEPTTTEVTPTSTETPTSTPTETPKPSWQTAMETQDPKDQFFKVVDGQPTIDRYDIPAQESIVLAPESIKSVPTTDGLNPNILTAQDAEGNKYAFNPDHGWFALPEVQMDYAKLAQYTEVDQAFIEDGRANITTALLYAENPTISPNAIDPVYWIGYNAVAKVPMLCNNACGLLISNYYYDKYTEESARMGYDATNKPFAWAGFYKVQLENGESIYVIGRTLKNSSDTNPNQTINLFYGFSKQIWESMYYNMLPSNRTELKMVIDGTDNGGIDIAAVLAPPEQFTDGTPIPYDPSTSNYWKNYFNQTMSGLEVRGQLISLFKDPAVIMDVIATGLQRHHVAAPLTEPIPNSFSKFILFSGFVNR